MSTKQIEFQLPIEAQSQAVTAWGIKDKLIGLILQTLQGLKGSLPPKDQVMAAAKAAFEKYVVAIDIPNIGPVIEHVVDEAMENAFLRFVSVAYDKLAAA